MTTTEATADPRTLAERFVAGDATIAYPELTERGGMVRARYANGFWWHCHETDGDPVTLAEPMTPAQALAMVPSDAIAA